FDEPHYDSEAAVDNASGEWQEPSPSGYVFESHDILESGIALSPEGVGDDRLVATASDDALLSGTIESAGDGIDAAFHRSSPAFFPSVGAMTTSEDELDELWHQQEPVSESAANVVEKTVTISADEPSPGSWTFEYRPKPRETWNLPRSSAAWPELEPTAVFGQEVSEVADIARSGSRMAIYADSESSQGQQTRSASTRDNRGTVGRGRGSVDPVPGVDPWGEDSLTDSLDPVATLLEDWEIQPELDAHDAEPILPKLVDIGSWTPEPIAVAQSLPRICRTCRDYRAGDSGGRGWCANEWAFGHRQLVDADGAAPCRSQLGSWWLPADELLLGDADISAHARATPNLDRWLPEYGDQERQRRQS
ncbi:MAG: hypothetical protein ACR2J8_13275, partial [Thermomicrobiales bacterium]